MSRAKKADPFDLDRRMSPSFPAHDFPWAGNTSMDDETFDGNSGEGLTEDLGSSTATIVDRNHNFLDPFVAPLSAHTNDDEPTDTNTANTTKGEERPLKLSRRKKKPKGMPRRSLTAYNLFFRQVRSELIQHSEHVTFEQMGKIVGSRWKVLPEDERAKYVKLAHNDTLRYQSEMKIFEDKRKKDQEHKDAAMVEALRRPSNLPKKTAIESILPDHCRLESLPSDWIERNMSETGSPFPIAPGTVVSVPQPGGTEQKFKVEYKLISMKQHEAKKFMADLSDLSKPKTP